MADGVNKVMLLGRLGAAPELRVTQGGLAVLSMRVATNDSYVDKEKVRRERTDWHTVVIFGRRAEALSKILAKGMPVFVEGSLRTSSYEKDGSTRYKTEVVAQNLLLIGNAGREAEGEAPYDTGEEGRPEAPGREHPRAGRSASGSRSRAAAAASAPLPYRVPEEVAVSESAYGESAYGEGGERDIPF